MKTVYVIRHSECLYGAYNNEKISEGDQIKNEKMILSCTGEEKARLLAEDLYLKDVDEVWSSHYVRAIGTAKYIARNNNVKINIDEDLGERKVGKLGTMDPSVFALNQAKDFDYKLVGGESIKETKIRMSGALKRILSHDGDKFVIISHSTAILSLFLNWCELGFNYDNKAILTYKGEVIHDGVWNAPLVFKLVFDDNKQLIEIKK